MRRFLPLLIGLIATTNVIIFTPGVPQTIYYGCILLVFISLASSEKLKFNGLLSIMVAISILSIWANVIPDYFKAEERFIAFIIGLALFSPLFYNQALGNFRKKLFNLLNWIFISIVIISFIGKISGLYSGIGRANIFQGITNHPMLLAPISAVAFIFSFWKLLESKNFKNKFIFACSFMLCFLVLLLAGSRGSLIGGVIGFLVLLFTHSKLNINKIFRIALIAFACLSLSFPYWSNYTISLNKKMEYGKEQGDLTASRSDLWNYRLKEFNESPFLGIGFSNSEYGSIDEKTGIIEPGTSWGVIFAQIGLFGGIPFFILCINYWVKIKSKMLVDNYNIFLVALLSFLFVHWIIEGYMLASGSFLFLLGWLVLGVIDNELRNYKMERTAFTLS